MASQDLKDDSFEKINIDKMTQLCFPLENDVVLRLSQSCTHLKFLNLTGLSELKEESQMSVVGLLRNIIQNNPPLIHLNLSSFGGRKEINKGAGDIILEALLN